MFIQCAEKTSANSENHQRFGFIPPHSLTRALMFISIKELYKGSPFTE
uniref:Uncharacterized protein n=1 Tax=Anguilla anguilla TaxID=7936 RepID=A0A0E9QHA5_ANGAN